MKFKQCVIHIQGIDKTGKDTIRDRLVKLSQGKILVIVRSYISQIVYSNLYKRNIDIAFFENELLRCINQFDQKIVIITASDDIIQKRFIQHSENDLEIKDITKHKNAFFNYIYDLNDRHDLIKNKKMIIVNSNNTIQDTIDNIITFLIQNNLCEV